MYLTKNDFFVIQDTQLKQITQNNDARLWQSVAVAQEETSSYLLQRFDVSKEFTNTNPWSYTLSYNVGDRVILDYNTYSPLSTYALNSMVIYSGNAYICMVAITVAEAFNSAHWGLIGAQYSLYYASYPVISGITYPEFNINNVYKIGNEVYWKGYTYVCAKDSPLIGSEEAIQYVDIRNIPNYNVFPDDMSNNADGQYWSAKTAYSVSSGILPSNTVYWVNADNRSQQMVMYVTDISIYHLHRSIAPANIPELRIKAYDNAISWLRAVSKGTVTPNLPQLQPNQGTKYRYNGKIKLNNAWVIFFAFLSTLQYFW